MSAILDLPYQRAEARARAASEFEHDSPPDFQYFFEERQYQFAALGLKVLDTAAQLRELGELPPAETKLQRAEMQSKQRRIEKVRAERAMREN